MIFNELAGTVARFVAINVCHSIGYLDSQHQFERNHAQIGSVLSSTLSPVLSKATTQLQPQLTVKPTLKPALKLI
ncbi:hypothetical protein A6J60_007360 [Psychrobacter sp. FDAARGOS_221]|nr:hypothetical protein A6J60_007360 [Psychrobacter sp. FDAARGOS_221]